MQKVLALIQGVAAALRRVAFPSCSAAGFQGSQTCGALRVP